MQRLAFILICALALAGCGGGAGSVVPSTGSNALNGSKHAMATPTCAPAWVEGGTYSAGQMVSYNPGSGTHNYTSLVSQTDYSGTGWNPTVGSLYSDDGACGGTSTTTPSPTPTPTHTPTPTPTPTHTPTPTPTPTHTPTPTPTPSSTPGSGCAPAWVDGGTYSAGQMVSYNNGTRTDNYTALVSQTDYVGAGYNPTVASLWKDDGPCGASVTPTPSPTATPSAGPPPAFVFSPYKDITVGNDLNTDEMMSFGQPTYQAMPAGDTTLDWAFATGQCGSETWAGIPPTGSPSLVSGNVPNWVSAGKKYIISTGGAAYWFACDAGGAAFVNFIKTYYSSSMIGVDFDIEYDQSQSTVDNLINDVKYAQANGYGNLRYSFTVATLGGTVGLPAGGEGDMVVRQMQSLGLGGDYTVDLMTMDYGSPSTQNCVVVNGQCEMGQSAVQAAVDLHDTYGIPYGNIEICAMTGANDTAGETFTLADADTVSSFIKQNGIGGLHFWSFDRDSGLSYTNQFINDGM